jgi:hypothetical protein
MDPWEQAESSEFFTSLRRAMTRGIRIKAIMVKKSAFPKHWYVPPGFLMQFCGITVDVID